ncbi:MAG: glycerol-3-phosphate 1-O-acyltransferase PlsY, partial [Alphaproteobacteria bacterium]|nr:glycerol-3-phosphate 1-O-acyltransferase PlsY [Alphaproteobacteria bacterium]
MFPLFAESFLAYKAYIALLFVGAYVLGSVPFGLILTKLAGLGDIRNIGSGNIGATNVLRTGNKQLAFLTLFLDGGKGGLAVYIGTLLTQNEFLAMLMGICAVVGHIYPVFLKFKGGKGVATAIGFYMMLSWELGIMVILMWLIIAFVLRKSSAAAIAAIGAAPFFAWFQDMPQYTFQLMVLSTLIIYKHKANIERLFKGTEPNIGKK